MNGNFKKSVIAVAITALLGTATAYAQDNVQFNKKLKLQTDVSLTGDPTVSGNINIDSAAIAIVRDTQTNTYNTVDNGMVTNDASAADNVAANIAGNVGMNIAAGDNNQQDNAAALSAADASFAFGMADAEVFVDQSGTLNYTDNLGTTNAASLGGSAFSAASGNIGVNVTAGNNNQQKNSMAASVATTNYAQASVASDQSSGGNYTNNQPFEDSYMTSVQVSLAGSGSGTYGGTSSGSASLGLSGAVDQIGDVYPDTWTGNTHPNGSQTGHIDLDTETQGGSDLNADGGALAFGYTADSAASGDVSLEERGSIDLANINLSGSVNYSQISYLPTTNTASLSGDAFNGASGNIGINVAAGTGNQQANSLALAVAQPSVAGGGGTGGE
ncbi:MAG: adhesin [Rhodanobacter sp.]|jgi:hypothetical protein